MRERSRDKSRLEHILQAIERINRYTEGKTFDDFIADDMMYYAVERILKFLAKPLICLLKNFARLIPILPGNKLMV